MTQMDGTVSDHGPDFITLFGLFMDVTLSLFIYLLTSMT